MFDFRRLKPRHWGMANLGRINELMAVRESNHGLYLDAGDHGEVLLPKTHVPEGVEQGDTVTVFFHKDSSDRLVATTETPLAQVGDFQVLRVKSVEKVGAFLDWGLSKDLLLPFSEQRTPVREGQTIFVRVYLDPKSQRIVASCRLNRFLDTFRASYEEGDAVELQIAGKTDLGYSVIIESQHWGLLFEDEASDILHQGMTLPGFIKTVRPDEKIDVCLKKPGYERVTGSLGDIISALEQNEGFLPLHDKSSPEDIRYGLGMSKKTFKQAIGALYRKRLIILEEDGIRLVD